MQPVHVTIMIPTYNQESYLAEAVESCLAQDYPDIEIIVADDCSTDGTPDVSRRYQQDPRFVYVRNTENLGRVGNYRNTLLQHVRGEWVVNLDGDDYYTDSRFISGAVADIASACSSGMDVVAYLGNHDMKPVMRWIPESRELPGGARCCPGVRYFREYPRVGRFAHMSCLYHAATAKRLGGYTLDFVASDFHALMRVFLQGQVVLGAKNPGVWRVHGANASMENLKDKYMKAFDMYEDLARFASPYVEAEELFLWKKEMQDGAYDDYILTLCQTASRPVDFLPLLRDFRFRRVQLFACRLLARRLLHVVSGNR